MPATTTTASIAVAAAVTPAMRHAGLISNQRSRMPADSAAALRAAAAANPPASEAVSIIGAARSSAASVPWHRAHPEKCVSRARALDPAERVFIVGRNHVGGGTLGAPGRVRLLVAGTARGAKRELDRGRETVI